ncbi:hypothetical protein ACFE04_013589 [Oxalis oulophora]
MAPKMVGEALALVLVREGISRTLSLWWILQKVVQDQCGGPDSPQIAENLASDILSWFTHSQEPLYVDDLEEILMKAFDSLPIKIVDDGCITEDCMNVAEKLLIMHGECLEGNYQSILKLREATAPKFTYTAQKVNDDDDSTMVDDGSSNMIVDVQKPQPKPHSNSVVNDDGSMVDDGSSNMMVDVPKSPNSNSVQGVAGIDADGWTKVCSRKARKK